MEDTDRFPRTTNWRPLNQVFELPRYRYIPNPQKNDEVNKPFQHNTVESSAPDVMEEELACSGSAVDNTRGEFSVGSSTWRVGSWARFPIIGFTCLLVITAMLAAIIIVLLLSDGADVDSWGSTTVNIVGRHHHWTLSVSAFISLANFITLKALAVMFAEAVAVSWWVDAARGQTLEKLHFRWEVGQSVFNVVLRRQIASWISLAGIAFTTFAALEVLLQQASSSTTALSSSARNMTAAVANAFPVGFSGVWAALSHDIFGTVYLTSPFVKVLQTYTSQTPINLNLRGCGSTSNVSCTTSLPGIGFQYTCNSSRSSLLTPLTTGDDEILQPVNSVFQVEFVGGLNWNVSLHALWQDEPGYDGPTVSNRHCILVPAQVEYPVNVTQNTASLQPPNASISWTTRFNEGDEDSLKVDKVLSLLPMSEHDKWMDTELFDNFDPGTHTTLGGLVLAFSTLIGSSITVASDITNNGADINVVGSFAVPFANFRNGTGNVQHALNNTYPSPMDAILSNIRDIMFRSSIAVAELRVGDYAWIDSTQRLDEPTSNVPAQNTTSLGQYNVYHTVYKTNRLILGIAIGLMVLAILAILPLYYGYWRLGRKVSLSPLEVAKAFHYSTVIDKRTGMRKAMSVLDIEGHPDAVPQSGSNHSADELVKLLGSKEVKYGEVAANTLGVGLVEHTEEAQPGRIYH